MLGGQTHQLLLSICPNDVKAVVIGRSILLNLKLCLAVVLLYELLNGNRSRFLDEAKRGAHKFIGLDLLYPAKLCNSNREPCGPL